MKKEYFDKMLEKRIDSIRKTLSAKEFEYTSHGDRLGNFKSAAKFLECSPERVLISYLSKPIECIFSYVRRGVTKSKQILWKEKIGAAINYLILLEALIEEQENDFAEKEDDGI